LHGVWGGLCMRVFCLAWGGVRDSPLFWLGRNVMTTNVD
jgi:hypothetical protein